MGLHPGDPGYMDALQRAFADFHERNTPCRAGCEWGWVVIDPTDIDPYSEEPRRSHCPTCLGTAFVPRQMELPL